MMDKSKRRKISIMEEMGITFQQVGDYQIPQITLEEQQEVGIYGLKRMEYLKKHRNIHYNALILSGELNKHLVEIDKQAKTQMEKLMEQMMEKNGITEQLKAQNQIKWVQEVNNIKNRAEEIVLKEIVYNN